MCEGQLANRLDVQLQHNRLQPNSACASGMMVTRNTSSRDLFRSHSALDRRFRPEFLDSSTKVKYISRRRVAGYHDSGREELREGQLANCLDVQLQQRCPHR